MSITVSIPYIDKALGHSVVYEQYKGNFAEARWTIVTALRQARQSGNAEKIADALLACGVVRLLQGEPAAALPYFAEVERAAPGDQVRALRAVSYAQMAEEWAFGLFPNWRGANAFELDAHWDRVAWAQEGERWVKLTSTVTDPIARLEAEFVSKLVAAAPRDRGIAAQRDSNMAWMNEQSQKIALALPAGFAQRARDLNAHPSILAYIDTVVADMRRLGGHPDEAQVIFQHCHTTYIEAGDIAGVAASMLLWGDWLAAPLSSPMVWNADIREGPPPDGILDWQSEAREFKREGVQIGQARAAYAEAERLFMQAHAPRGLAALQLRYGYLCMLEGNYAGAIEHAREAGRRFEIAGDQYGAWTARAHEALSRIGAGELREQTETATAIGRWGVSDGSFSFALGLGIFFGRMARRWMVWEGDYERALAAYRLAAVLFTALGATVNVAQSLTAQGRVYEAISERSGAVTCYEQALGVYERDVIGRPEYDRTLEGRAGGDQPGFGGQTLRLSAALLTLDLYKLASHQMDADGMERAATRLQQQLAHLPAGSDSWQGAVRVLSTGVATLGSAVRGGVPGIMAEGERLLSASLLWAFSRAARQTIEEAYVLVPLYRAEQQRKTGSQDEAERLYGEALAATGKVSSGYRYLLEAAVHGHQEHYDQALAAYKRYLSEGGLNTGFVGTLVGAMRLFGGAAGKAQVRKQELGNHELALTLMVRCKAYAEAKTHLEALEHLAGSEWWVQNDRPWQGLCDAGELYEDLNDFTSALRYYDRAIEQFEARRSRLTRDELKTALAGDRDAQFLYFLAARCALKQHEAARQAGNVGQVRTSAAAAFSYAERGKARALLDMMAASATIAALPTGESDELYAWRKASTRLALWRGLLAREHTALNPDTDRITHLTAQISTAEEDLRRAEAALATTNRQFAQTVNPQAPIISLAQLSAGLPGDTALLQYYFAGKDFLAWAITREGMVQTQRTALDSKALERQLRGFHHGCATGKPTELPGKQIAELFLALFDDVLRRVSRLLIVPYGAAHTLPFHALPWQGQPLAATHTIAYLPNASVLQFLRRERTALPEQLLAVGNPAHMSYEPAPGAPRVEAPALQAAAVEAAFVASLFPNGEALLGEQATEEAVTARVSQFPLLHFATHGVLSEEAPLLSSILLANGQELSVYELMGMRLNADLVVLSACRTAQGETTSGDEVLGLTRGLLAAGARAAIVSLWPVNDLATSLLMGHFYQRLQAGDDPARALQAAQKYLRGLTPDQVRAELGELSVALHSAGVRDAVVVFVDEECATRDARPTGAVDRQPDYSHPCYWAPFVLVGI